MFFVARDDNKFLTARNGGNQRIVVRNRTVFGFGHQTSPFRSSGFVKRKNGFAIILRHVAVNAFQRESRFAAAFEFDAATDFRKRQSGNADFARMRGEPIADGIAERSNR